MEDNNVMTIENQQKLYLIEQGFVYNPMHESYQRIKYTTDTARCFYNVTFPYENEDPDTLSITEQTHDFTKPDTYTILMLFIGKSAKTLAFFKAIVNTVLVENRVVNNEMVRHMKSILEKHDYLLVDKKTQAVMESNKTKTYFEYCYEKTVGNFTLKSYIELPSNRVYFTLSDNIANTKISLLNISIPESIAELNNILNHIPLLLHSTVK